MYTNNMEYTKLNDTTIKVTKPAVIKEDISTYEINDLKNNLTLLQAQRADFLAKSDASISAVETLIQECANLGIVPNDN